MSASLRVAISLVLMSSQTPVTASTQETEASEPPSIPVTLIHTPSQFITPEPGKSRQTEADEQRRQKEEQIREEQLRKAAEAARQSRARQVAQRPSPPLQYSSQQPPSTTTSSATVIGTSNEQCVIYVRRVTGNQKVSGYAGNLRPEGFEPRVGAAALERNRGHVSVVIAIDGDYLVLNDANWIRGAITQRRVHKSTQRGYIY